MRSVHGAIQHKGGSDAIIPETTDECCGFPVTIRDLVNQPFALRSPTIKAGHLSGGGSLIDEDKSFRIKSGLFFLQRLTGGDDIFPILLCCAKAFF